MPHIIIECSRSLISKNFNLHALVAELHTCLDGRHGVTQDRVKTRAHVTDHFHVGNDGDQGEMLHIDLRLVPGRDDGQKSELAQILRQAADANLANSKFGPYPRCAVTVEVSELHGPSYQA